LDQPSATTPDPVPAKPAGESPARDAALGPDAPPGFGARGRVRRRARFLRKARELAYRDLGGLVFNLHRFGHRNDALVLAKLDTLGRIDTELRALESALGERQSVTVLREAGVTACPRCAAIHSGEDRFCPNCGLSMSRHVDLPIAGAPTAPAGGPNTPAGAANPDPSPVHPTGAPANGPAAAPHSPAPGAAASMTPPASADPSPDTSTTAHSSAPLVAPVTDQPTEIIRPPVGEA
jgi:hypothetical protein